MGQFAGMLGCWQCEGRLGQEKNWDTYLPAPGGDHTIVEWLVSVGQAEEQQTRRRRESREVSFSGVGQRGWDGMGCVGKFSGWPL